MNIIGYWPSWKMIVLEVIIYVHSLVFLLILQWWTVAELPRSLVPVLWLMVLPPHTIVQHRSTVLRATQLTQHRHRSDAKLTEIGQLTTAKVSATIKGRYVCFRAICKFAQHVQIPAQSEHV